MALEWREEACEECGETYERQWSVQAHAVGAPIPKGYRTEKRGKSWTTIAGPTRWTTLCLCDAP